jgi:photosystem II stability/assembly factor-like uncharacterized protein
MNWKSGAAAIFLAAAAVTLDAQQSRTTGPKDDGYKSTYVPTPSGGGPDNPTKDDPKARLEDMRERMGGDFSSDFVASLAAAADAQRAEYGPAGRGAIKVPAGGPWTNIGPDRSSWIQNGGRLTQSDTGRVRTFLVHPGNDDIVYVLTSSGGLWKTTNFSEPRPAWRAMTDTILSTSGGGAAFGKNPETIYLATGDPFDPGVGGYAYKSTDGGETWAKGVKLGPSSVVPDVKVDTTGPTDVVLMGTNAGLFRSTDGGATYVPVLSGLVWSLQRTSAGWVAARTVGAVGSIVVSTDRGATWSPIRNQGAPSGIGRATLASATPGEEIVYAFASTTGSAAQKDLYRSTDGGLSWTGLGLATKTPVNPNAEQQNMNIMQDQAFYNQMLLVDPSDPSRNTVYIGGQLSSAKTTDGGATWRVITNWLAQFGLPYVHADHHAAAFATVDGVPTLLFGGDGGLFVSTDGGASFSSLKNDGLASYLIYAMTGNPAHTDDALIGLQDNGTRFRTGTGGTYNQVFGGDGFGVAWSQAKDNVSLGSVYYSYILRNVRNPPNQQGKWLVGFNGITEFFNPATTYFNTALAAPAASADPDGLTFFHRTRFKLYRTTNGAASWQSVFETPAPARGAARVALRAGSHPIGISPIDLRNFGVLGNGGHLWFTTDGGATFNNRVLTTVAPGWPGFNATLAYASNTTMYVGNEAPIGTGLRVIKSTDGGNTWANASTGLPPVPISKLLVSTRDANTVYAATWIGVYETTNGGQSWHLFGQGLPVVNVSDLYMPTDGSYLRVATYGRGVWEIRF